MVHTDDLNVPLSSHFTLPTFKAVGAKANSEDADKPCTYLCGNSLGAISRRSEEILQEEIEVWKTRAVVGHFNHPHGRSWTAITDRIHTLLAKVVGAKDDEVVCMGTLTANLHLMMGVFYTPNQDRFKIICEAKAFPSDQYAFVSQIAMHGFDPQTALIELSPREGELSLRTEDILQVIRREGPSVALVLLSGVQFYSGQYFNIGEITETAHEVGAMCGWDLAHAVGNVDLSLHDDDVDFAVWCSYKYLNSGPGGIAGLFVHEKWDHKKEPRLSGWWGNDLKTRFDMEPQFQRYPGAKAYQQSNPDILSCASLLGSLESLESAGGIKAVRQRSIALTSRLFQLLTQSRYYIPSSEHSTSTKSGFTVITPKESEERGAQLSLLFLPTGTGLMNKVFDGLVEHGVIGDERKPNVIRLAPAPLYNSLLDCTRAAEVLEEVLVKIIGPK